MLEGITAPGFPTRRSADTLIPNAKRADVAAPTDPCARCDLGTNPLEPSQGARHGTDALVIYAPPREFTFDHPGSPDDCQSTDPVPAHESSLRLFYDLDEVDVARPPGARTSYDTVIMDGIVLLRLPLARLAAGTTDVAGVNLSGGDEEFEWGLSIGLRLTSEAGSF